MGGHLQKEKRGEETEGVQTSESGYRPHRQWPMEETKKRSELNPESQGNESLEKKKKDNSVKQDRKQIRRSQEKGIRVDYSVISNV